MQRITLTEMRKLSRIEIETKVPLEITADGDVIARLVPKNWKDPRFVYRLGDPK